MGGLRLDGVQPRVLAPVDLTVAPGELVFVSGPSGSGKSLLLRAVADLDPHAGEVWLDGEARSAMAPSRWRRRVGLLPAESFWWTDSVGEHFPAESLTAKGAPADESETRGRGASVSDEGPGESLIAVLALLGFEPGVLGWAVSRLSTGERQRLALARMLAQRPEALLLDEATANLDPANRERVEQVVQRYRSLHDAAVIWVSHDPEQRSRLGGRQLGIRDGQLVATG